MNSSWTKLKFLLIEFIVISGLRGNHRSSLANVKVLGQVVHHVVLLEQPVEEHEHDNGLAHLVQYLPTWKGDNEQKSTVNIIIILSYDEWGGIA